MSDGHRCPRCEGPLAWARREGVEIELCTACQGMLVPRGRLVPVLDAMTKELLKTLDPHAELDPAPSGAARIQCPSCGAAMEQNGYMGTTLVEIDSCPRCMSVWLDADELGVMAMLYARTELRGIAREQEAKAREPSVSRAGGVPLEMYGYYESGSVLGAQVREIILGNFFDLLT